MEDIRRPIETQDTTLLIVVTRLVEKVDNLVDQIALTNSNLAKQERRIDEFARWKSMATGAISMLTVVVIPIAIALIAR